MTAAAVLVAAGSGQRLGAGQPKAFVRLAGRPLLEWSLDALRTAGFDDIVVALPPGFVAPSGCRGVTGGATRSESVRLALAACPAGDAVVVHDAARALVPPALFEQTLAALADADAAIAAAPMTDTVKEADYSSRLVAATLDRSRLWLVQTPQAFRRDVLERALDVPAAVLAEATDDASLVERAGGRVRVVESSAENFKVTTPYDFKVAELLLRERQPC